MGVERPLHDVQRLVQLLRSRRKRRCQPRDADLPQADEGRLDLGVGQGLFSHIRSTGLRLSAAQPQHRRRRCVLGGFTGPRFRVAERRRLRHGSVQQFRQHQAGIQGTNLHQRHHPVAGRVQLHDHGRHVDARGDLLRLGHRHPILQERCPDQHQHHVHGRPRLHEPRRSGQNRHGRRRHRILQRLVGVGVRVGSWHLLGRRWDAVRQPLRHLRQHRHGRHGCIRPPWIRKHRVRWREGRRCRHHLHAVHSDVDLGWRARRGCRHSQGQVQPGDHLGWRARGRHRHNKRSQYRHADLGWRTRRRHRPTNLQRRLRHQRRFARR